MFNLYRLFNAADELLYVGLTRQPVHRRMYAHRAKRWKDEIARVEVTVLHCTKADADALEIATIKAEHPKYNQVRYQNPPARHRPRPTRPPLQCGTYGAAKRHMRVGEELDPACLAEYRRYMADAQQRTRDRRKANDPPIGHQVRT